jgi:hypothetical protein
VERTPEKKAKAEPSTKQNIEAFPLRASLFQAHLSIMPEHYKYVL